jgi:hypothetical protein
MEQDQIEHVERAHRDDPGHQRRLAVAVEGLQREPAGVDFAALFHEAGDLIVEVEMPRERLVAKGRKTALNAERHAGAVQQNRGLEPFAQQAFRLQQIHQADRPLEGHGVKGDQRLLARLRLDVLEHFFFIVDEEVALFVGGVLNSRHACVPSECRQRRESTNHPRDVNTNGR